MTVKTIVEAEAVLGEYAQVDAKLQKINAEMDSQINKIREKYVNEITSLNANKERLIDELQHFAETNPDHFEKRKSIEMVHGVIGFRTGTPKLRPLKKCTWASITEALKVHLPNYIRTVDEPDKVKLLADRDDERVMKLMPKVGCEVVQDETFYVELKKEEVA